MLSSKARLRHQAGFLYGARPVPAGERSAIEFYGPGAMWAGKNLQLCHPLKPNEPQTFRTLEEAESKLRSLGW